MKFARNYKFTIEFTISENERKTEQSRCIKGLKFIFYREAFKELLLLKQLRYPCCLAAVNYSDRLLLFILTIFLLLIGQKARNSGCDWFN